MKISKQITSVHDRFFNGPWYSSGCSAKNVPLHEVIYYKMFTKNQLLNGIINEEEISSKLKYFIVQLNFSQANKKVLLQKMCL